MEAAVEAATETSSDSEARRRLSRLGQMATVIIYLESGTKISINGYDTERYFYGWMMLYRYRLCTF